MASLQSPGEVNMGFTTQVDTEKHVFHMCFTCETGGFSVEFFYRFSILVVGGWWLALVGPWWFQPSPLKNDVS